MLCRNKKLNDDEIDVPLLKKVLDFIKQDLRRLEMHVLAFRGRKNLKHAVESGYVDRLAKNIPPCGTKACLAGWTVMLTTPKKDWAKLFDNGGRMVGQLQNAGKLLGLYDYEQDKVFEGNAIEKCTAKEQFAQLKEDINDVLESRGMKERV